MKILFVSNLFPSAVAPGMASYNRQLMAALAMRADVRVVAPVAWFPAQRILRGRRLPPKSETLAGIPVTHPRFFYTPGVLIHQHWRFYRASVARHLRRVIAEFAPDHVVAGFLYPDGAAVLSLCQAMGIPCTVRVNGSDFRLRMTQPRFRHQVLRVLHSAEAVFCPGQALKRDILAAGTERSRIFAFNNGVDHGLFKVQPKAEAMDRLLATGSAITAKVMDRLKGGAQAVLYVGHLRHVKGTDRMLHAFQTFGRTPEGEKAVLVVIGHGNMLVQLKREAELCGMGERICFIGDRPHAEVALWMNTADCLCLPSRSEGMPNVVVEALASGLPVVATDVGEVPFLLSEGVNGTVIRTGECTDAAIEDHLARGISHVLRRSWDRSIIADSVAHMTWPRAAEIVLEGLEKRRA